MSHTTAVEGVVFSDIEALRAAVNELVSKGIKCSLEKDATPRAFYQNQQGMEQAPYVLRLHDAMYDVGFYLNPAIGGYEARTDLFRGSVQGVLGVQKTPEVEGTAMQLALGKLSQTYAIHAATRKAVSMGHQVRRIDNSNGSVRLVVSGIR